jgi:hypothetical protein
MKSLLRCLHSFGGGTKSARFLAALAVALLLLSYPSGLRAQALSGINGTVTDPGGVPVPDAKVTVTNTDTGVSRTTETTSAGTYYITDLIPGSYTVKIEKPGFKAFVQNSVTVQAGTQSSASASLVLGNVTDTIEVTASEISLQADQPVLSTTIQETLVQELPQIISGAGRQIDSFLFLAPGVTGDSFSHRINGGLDFQNEVVFNGVPIAFAETQGYQYYINPPFELVKEFTVLQGSFSAQYGLSQGVAQYQFKSGTNSIHGDAFAVYRDAFFDAAGAVYNVNPNNQGIIGKPKTDHEINYGFTAGGPVLLPKLYHGKDKTFWFFSLEKFRQAHGQTPVTIPTQAMLNGDFSGLFEVDTKGNRFQVPIMVPIAWASNPSLMPAGCVPGANPGQRFPNNTIPQSCFSSVSKSLLGFVPKPSTSGDVNNYSPTFVPVNTWTNWGLTIDHNLTSKQALHGVYWRNRGGTQGGFVENPLNNATTNYLLGSGLLLTYSNAITPRLVVTGGFSWIGETNNFYQQNPIGSFAGARPSPSGGVYLPGINFDGGPWEPVSWGTGGWQFSINRKHGLAIINNWLYTRGRHTMNFGVDIRRTFQDDDECQHCAGTLHFSSTTTADGNGVVLRDPNTGNPVKDPNGDISGAGFASFLLGVADSADRQFAAMTRLRNSYVAPYFQDNTKITPRFTLNWGLRWDLAFPFSNDNNSNQLVFFNPLVPNPGAIDPKTSQPRLGAMAILGAGCNGCVGWNNMDMQWKHFSPRLGFAYQLNNKTVLLAGLSFSFLDTGAYEYGVNKVAVNFGNNLNGTVSYSGQPNQVPGFGQWDTTALPSPPKPPFTPDFFNTNSTNEMHKHVLQGYSEVLTVGVQRELPWKMFASVGYVHTHDLHLPASLLRRNELNASYLSMCPTGLTATNQCVLGQPFTSAAGQAALQAQGFGQCGGVYTPYCNFRNDYGNTFLARALLPFPQFRNMTNNFDTSGADKYDGLQASLQKRTGSGLTFLVAYTLSRTLSNTDSGFSTFNFKGLNQLNPNAEWSIGNDDRTHVLNIAHVYELPIGPGKKLLNRGGLVMKNLVGGWQFSGIYTYRSATPLQIFAAGAINNTPLFYSARNRPNILPGSFNVNWNNYYTGQPIVNVNKWAAPGVWTIGNAAPLYSDLRNPFQSNETVGLAKKFFFGERVTAELRVDFDNILNRMQVCGGLDHNSKNNAVVGDLSGNFGYFGGRDHGNVSNSTVCQGNSPRKGQAFFQIKF